jgi:hypothetical protein
MIPTPGGNKSGGRIVDSFTLMPSWIRNLIKINGKAIVDVDFATLHPNIAMSLYDGTIKYLTHQQVSDELGIDVLEVKVAHLSFFNKRWPDMESSKIFNYYEKNEALMLQNLRMEKDQSLYGHKVTSRNLFRKEVEIMTAVVEELNEMEIYVGYIYDALFCNENDRFKVKEVMNKTILEHGVFTTAKIED